jgi:soluble P-type ATPase
MLEIVVPGSETLRLEHLVADFNGTLAYDGRLLPGVDRMLRELAARLCLHVVTADTFGSAKHALADIPCELVVLPDGHQDRAKARYVEALGANRCVSIGNGRNDRLMLAVASLGIAVVQREGAAVQAVLAAEIVVPDVDTALGLLLNPSRLIATLRT